jgi:hypothetical protein
MHEKGHGICWAKCGGLTDETRHHIQKIQGIHHISHLEHPVSGPSFNISPIWTPTIAAEVRRLHLRPAQILF